MARPAGQLERALYGATVELQQRRERRKVLLADSRSGDYIQHVHVPLSGQAGTGVAWIEELVKWELPFLNVPLQRRVTYETPHFSCSITFTTPPSSHVDLVGQLVGWVETEERWIVGARVRFIVSAPLVGVGVIPYSAIAHLSFLGYATYSEGEDFTE